MPSAPTTTSAFNVQHDAVMVPTPSHPCHCPACPGHHHHHHRHHTSSRDWQCGAVLYPRRCAPLHVQHVQHGNVITRCYCHAPSTPCCASRRPCFPRHPACEDTSRRETYILSTRTAWQPGRPPAAAYCGRRRTPPPTPPTARRGSSTVPSSAGHGRGLPVHQP